MLVSPGFFYIGCNTLVDGRSTVEHDGRSRFRNNLADVGVLVLEGESYCGLFDRLNGDLLQHRRVETLVAGNLRLCSGFHVA